MCEWDVTGAAVALGLVKNVPFFFFLNVVPPALILRGVIPVCVCAGMRAHGGRHVAASSLFRRIFSGAAYGPQRFEHRSGETRPPLKWGEGGRRGSGGVGGQVGRGSRGGRHGSRGKYSVLCSCLCG